MKKTYELDLTLEEDNDMDFLISNAAGMSNTLYEIIRYLRALNDSDKFRTSEAEQVVEELLEMVYETLIDYGVAVERVDS